MSGSLHNSCALIEKPEVLTSGKKRKRSVAEELTHCKKSRNDTRNTRSLNEVINLGMPHVGELIFESIDTPALFQCALVSESWKVLAENVLIKRWKGKIFVACQIGETKVVKLLLERCNSEESGLNIKDECGMTGLMWACFIGWKDVVQLLLNHSERIIELNPKDDLGVTAFMLACENGHKDVVQLLLDRSDRNIELNTRDRFGSTAFMRACKKGNTDVVKLLLDRSDRNIELNTRDRFGSTAFMLACKKGNTNVVKLLLKYSEVIDINITDESLQLSEEIKTLIIKHTMTIQK